MDKIQFQTNVPQELRLAFLEGKLMPSNYGGNQHMFSTVDDRCFFVSEAVGNILHDQIRKQDVHKGDLVEVVKAEVDGGRGRKSIQWKLSKMAFAPGEQPDGTFAVPPPNGNGNGGAGVRAPAPHANGAPATGSTAANHNKPVLRIEPRGFLETGSGQALLQAGVAAVDLAAALERYAAETNYSLRFSAEDIRCTMLSIFIDFSRNGGRQ